MSSSEALEEVERLVEAITGLAELPAFERAMVIPELIEQAKAVLSGMRREAIVEVAREMGYAQAAEQIGVSKATINKAVVNYYKKMDHA